MRATGRSRHEQLHEHKELTLHWSAGAEKQRDVLPQPPTGGDTILKGFEDAVRLFEVRWQEGVWCSKNTEFQLITVPFSHNASNLEAQRLCSVTF